MFDLQASSEPKHLRLYDTCSRFDGGSLELYAEDETGKRWFILLQCVHPDIRPTESPIDPINDFEWILYLDGRILEKYSEEEKYWIRLVEEASVPDEVESISDWNEDKKRFVFQDDVEALQKAEEEGINVGLSGHRSDFCEKFYSARTLMGKFSHKGTKFAKESE